MEYQNQSQHQNQPQRKSFLKIILEVVGASLILFIFLMLIYSGECIYKNTREQPRERPLLQEKEMPKKEEPPKVTLPKVLYNLAGPIQKLEKNSLILEANIPQLNEQGQLTPKIESRKVLITAKTKFSRLIFVAQEGKNQKTPQETNISFNDLNLKDYIEVISNQDISQAQEFEATQIRVLPR